MKAFITNGTLEYLQKKDEENEDINFYLMVNQDGLLTYYEDETKEVFEMARRYEVLSELGELQETGFVSMNHIPASAGSEPVIENQFKHRKHLVESMPGFQAFRFLRPLKGNTYIVLTQWTSKDKFNEWRESPQFLEAHKREIVKPPAHAPKRPFLKTYYMYEEDEDMEEGIVDKNEADEPS